MDRPAVSGPMDLPIMHDSDRYELVKDIGSGNFGVARLMRDKQSNELVAVKYIERGEKVSLFSSCFFSLVQFYFMFQFTRFLNSKEIIFVCSSSNERCVFGYFMVMNGLTL